jgi:hypothetical protein
LLVVVSTVNLTHFIVIDIYSFYGTIVQWMCITMPSVSASMSGIITSFDEVKEMYEVETGGRRGIQNEKLYK